MISLMASDAKEPLLENRVLSIPEGEGKTESLVIIRDARDTVFAPTICTRPRVFMREMAPGVTIRRIIFTDCGLQRWCY